MIRKSVARESMKGNAGARLCLWLLTAGVLTAGSWIAANSSARADTPEGPTGKVQQGLVGGTEVSEKLQETYGLLRLSNDSGTCSASLLRNDWAITAAHCVEQDDAKGNPIPDRARPGQNIIMPIGGFKLRGKWSVSQKKKVVRIETFRPYDVAIVQADSPFTVNGSTTGYTRGIFLDQFPYFGTPTGAVITVYGCGINQFAFGSGSSAVPSQMDGKYRMGHAKVTYEKDNRYWFPSEGGQMIAGGDSGGPSFATVGTSRETVLVGVHSEAQTFNVKGKTTDPSDIWKWVASTPEAGDAPIKPVWPQIENIIGKIVPPPDPDAPKPPVFTYTVPFDTSTKVDDTDVIYTVGQDGELLWHRHIMSQHRLEPRKPGPITKLHIGLYHGWNPEKHVGDGWLNGYKMIMPAGGYGIYALADNGTLSWHGHKGVTDGSYNWDDPATLMGTGWNNYKFLIPMGDNVMYTVTNDGYLLWQKYSSDVRGKSSWSSPMKVGWGWNPKAIFAGGQGVLYVVTADGKLMWYKHKDYLNPVAVPEAGATDAQKWAWIHTWAENKEVGTGWGDFTKLFSPGGGHIYGVLPNGDLMYYNHLGWEDGSYRWDNNVKIAEGWDKYVYAFAQITYAHSDDVVVK